MEITSLATLNHMFVGNDYRNMVFAAIQAPKEETRPGGNLTRSLFRLNSYGTIGELLGTCKPTGVHPYLAF